MGGDHDESVYKRRGEGSYGLSTFYPDRQFSSIALISHKHLHPSNTPARGITGFVCIRGLAAISRCALKIR